MAQKARELPIGKEPESGPLLVLKEVEDGCRLHGFLAASSFPIPSRSAIERAKNVHKEIGKNACRSHSAL